MACKSEHGPADSAQHWLSVIYRVAPRLFYGPQSKIRRVSISLVPDGYSPPGSRFLVGVIVGFWQFFLPLLVAGAGRISQRALAKWLAKTAPKDGNSLGAKTTRSTLEHTSSRGLHHLGASGDRARRDRISAMRCQALKHLSWSL